MCGRCTISDPTEQQLRFGFVEFVETRVPVTTSSRNLAPYRAVSVVVEHAVARYRCLIAAGGFHEWAAVSGDDLEAVIVGAGLIRALHVWTTEGAEPCVLAGEVPP
jgi:hypothetical protein